MLRAVDCIKWNLMKFLFHFSFAYSACHITIISMPICIQQFNSSKGCDDVSFYRAAYGHRQDSITFNTHGDRVIEWVRAMAELVQPGQLMRFECLRSKATNNWRNESEFDTVEKHQTSDDENEKLNIHFRTILRSLDCISICAHVYRIEFHKISKRINFIFLRVSANPTHFNFNFKSIPRRMRKRRTRTAQQHPKSVNVKFKAVIYVFVRNARFSLLFSFVHFHCHRHRHVTHSTFRRQMRTLWWALVVCCVFRFYFVRFLLVGAHIMLVVCCIQLYRLIIITISVDRTP